MKEKKEQSTTRINKWKKYREEISENLNIYEAIINYDDKLSHVIKNMNFTFVISKEEKKIKHSFFEKEENKVINQLIDDIVENENLKPKEKSKRVFNSNEHSEKILDLFEEFVYQDFSDTTTELKINKFFLPTKIEGEQMNKKINIAIDGPSGVGKSTIAKSISSSLNLLFINTGLMYRAIAKHLLDNNFDILQEKEINNELANIKLELRENDQIFLNGQNISKNLYKDKISMSASKIAKYKSVRNFCVDLQRQIATENPGVVMEGRDIGSVVLPNAELKIFLTASPEIRAKRRISQLYEKGSIIENEQEVLQNIIDRDKNDRERKHAPLIKTKDAIEIDTSHLTIEEVIKKIIQLAEERME